MKMSSDAPPVLARENPVCPRLDLQIPTGRAATPAAGLEQRQVVLGVSQGQDVVRRQAQNTHRLLHPGALGHAAGQEHQRAPVVDDLTRDLRGGQRLPHRRFVGPGGAHDDPAGLVVDASSIQLRKQSPRWGWPLVADHGVGGIVENGAVLGNHRLE